MADKSRYQRVVEKYHLFEITDLETEDELKRRLGPGPIMSEGTLGEFLRRDPSGNAKYLEWMIFQAGGGQDVMEKILNLWNGEGANDPNSLRNQTREDYIQDRVTGYKDDDGPHLPLSRAEAERAWIDFESRSRGEFMIGDQDIASEGGYGFYRDWPGRDGRYAKIAKAVQLWHDSLPKLKAVNERIALLKKIEVKDEDCRSPEEDELLAESIGASRTPIELDIYAGWRPRELSQPKAVYKTLSDLLRSMADIRKLKALRDVRFEVIYEDGNVLALCPLTMGASLKFGCLKWCTANRSEFDRAFDPRNPGAGNWQTYCTRGPIVYMNWKRPMPEWQSKIAIHIEKSRMLNLAEPWTTVQFIDAQNNPGGTNFKMISDRMLNEHSLGTCQVTGLQEEIRLRWPDRKAGTAAWQTEITGQLVHWSFLAAIQAVALWAKTFDCKRIVLDYVTEFVGTGDED